MEQEKIDRAAETKMSRVWKNTVAVVLQSNVSRGVLAFMAEKISAELSKTIEEGC